MKHRGLFILFLLLPLFSLSAGTGLSIGGALDNEIVVPAWWNSGEDYLDLSSRFRLDIDYETEQTELKTSLLFSVDDLADMENFENLYSLKPEELSLSIYLENVDVKVGYQRISWGRADGINPTDTINPLDMSDLSNMAKQEREERTLPVLGAAFTFYPSETLILEGVLLPRFTPPALPDYESSIPAELGSPTVNFTYPEAAPQSFKAGLRANVLLSSIDFSFSYFYGWDEVPDMSITTEEITQGGFTFGIPSVIDLTYHRVHIIGGDFALPLGMLDFRGEAAFVITEDWEGDDISIRNPFFHYVLSAGYTFFDTLQTTIAFSQKITKDFKKVSDYTYNVQLPDQSLDYYDQAYTILLSPLISTQTSEYASTLVAAFSLPLFNDYLKASLATVYNFPSDYNDADENTKLGDFLISPSLTYQAVDALDIELGANLFFSLQKNSEGEVVSDPYTSFGMADGMDQFYLKVQYSF